jgi:6,7-dimethyl-8-ribityllumazine synthase
VRKISGNRGAGYRVLVVVTQWNELVCERLLAGALEELEGNDVTVLSVPGTWELPLAIEKYLDRTNSPDCVVALGCIMEGRTRHAELLSKEVTGSLMAIQLRRRIPVGYGIITANTVEDALDRAGMKLGNKGREAASAALEMVSLLSQISAY